MNYENNKERLNQAKGEENGMPGLRMCVYVRH